MADEEVTEEVEEKPAKARKKTKKQTAKVAQAVLDGDYGSGRERRIELERDGFDPDEVAVEVAKLRVEAAYG